MTKDVALPEYDQGDETCLVEVRELDIVGRAKWWSMSWTGEETDAKWDTARSNVSLVVLSTFYKDGEKVGQRVFEDIDVDVLLTLPGSKHDNPISRLLMAATEVNFLEGGTAKAAQKKSKTTQKSDSSSNSPKKPAEPPGS